LFSKYKKEVDTIFLDTSSSDFTTLETVNIVLSPSLYWVKKISLPVKNARDVKPLLPSLFEDYLPDGLYSYTAYKQGEDFFIFAYEDKKILELLNTKGITASQIQNVYFAQNELGFLDTAVKINERDSLYLKDDLLVLVPSEWVKESGDLDISSVSLSKKFITLKQFGHLINEKAIYILAGIFIFIIALIGIEYFITSQKTSTIYSQQEEIFLNHSLKPTMMQNRAMLKEYESLHVEQVKLRSNISYMLSINLKSTVKLSKISLKGKLLTFEFEGIEKGREKILEKDFDKNNIKYNAKYKKKTWHVEVKL